MAISFGTFGPYMLRRDGGMPTRESLNDFLQEAAEVRLGIGVYLLAVKTDRDWVPWYVGKTDKGFGRRFKAHYLQKKAFQILQEKAPDGDIAVMLLSRLTPKTGKLKKARRSDASTKTKALKSITQLEYEMIGLCHAKNRELINRSNVVFQDGFSVPGYCGPSADSKDRSAKALRALLRKPKY